MLKLIMAVSADGYLARGPEDDMSWTGKDDKAVFRLLTSVGAACGVGYGSWRLMPRELPGRSLVPITTDGRMVPNYTPTFGEVEGSAPVPDWAGYERSVTLGRFAYENPNGWLLGGPRVAYEALDIGLVDQVYLCRSAVVLHGEQPAFKPLYRDEVTPWLMRQGERANAGTPWRRSQRIQVGSVTVDAWSRMDVVRS